MYNKEQRKYIREALRLVRLSKKDKDFSTGRMNSIISLLNESDNIIKDSVILSEDEIKVNINNNPNIYYTEKPIREVTFNNMGFDVVSCELNEDGTATFICKERKQIFDTNV